MTIKNEKQKYCRTNKGVLGFLMKLTKLKAVNLSTD